MECAWAHGIFRASWNRQNAKSLDIKRPAAGRSKRMGVVLVFEEEERERLLGASVLERAGYRVLSTGTREETLTVLDGRAPIDLLFTEISMRDDAHAGLEVARRAVERVPTLAVIYTTGQGVTLEMRRLFVPRFAFLGKPYRATDLVQAASNALMTLRNI
jgi:CheY-like chemotaxis protein